MGSFSFKTARAVLASGFMPDCISSDIRRSQLVTLTEGDLRVSGTETFQIIAESMGNRLGLVLNCEVVMIGRHRKLQGLPVILTCARWPSNILK
jgi:hypothetical protein